VLGTPIVLWRASESIGPSAALDECPHRGARLSKGWVDGGCLVCPYHGWQYDGAGHCSLIPSAGDDAPIPSRARLEVVGATERYGLVWVNLSPVGEREPMPELPEAEDDRYVMVHELIEEWSVSAPQVMENGLDVSHVAFVHRNSVGSSASPQFGEFEVHRDGLDLSFVVEHTARITVQHGSNGGGTTRRVTHGQLVQPFVFRGVLLYPDTGLEHILFKTVTPVDDHRSLFCQFIARNDQPSANQLEAIRELDRRVQSEDKAVLEDLAADYPLDITAQVHTKADRMTIEYRRVLSELAE
jgi:phenylpropionate dioxygenase-like ring-hydroxylating dioxygenase large terminal subunit